jgi:uroporphyrinogen decarboxylase
MGEHGVVGLCMLLPHLLIQLREPAESALFDYYDHHGLLSGFMREWEEHLLAVADKVIESGLEPDFVFFPNSGAITMQSPEICREFTLPALKSLTARFKRAGIVTSLHSCGKERDLVKMAAEETDLDCIDPLEAPPMGDCDLREIKDAFGDRLALKGNLHTTEVMLRMTSDDVARAAREALEIGMPGGGFILSTGDQCGRDTPQANIAALADVCERYGTY